MSKSDQALAKSEDHDKHPVDQGADPDVVKVQPDEHGAPALPLLEVEAVPADQPPAGPGADLFSTWNDPAPLDEPADVEVAGDEAADDDA